MFFNLRDIETFDFYSVLSRFKGSALKLITIGKPEDPWNKPLALNVGIRRTSEDSAFIVIIDSDMIFAQNYLEVVTSQLANGKQAFVICRILDLPQETQIPNDEEKLLKNFGVLKSKSKMRHRWGTGAMQATHRKFFFRVRGYDEDLLWWGAMDGDMVGRARASGLQVVWIDNQTSMLHQWHPRKANILSDESQKTQARLYWRRNHDLARDRRKKGIIVRNSENWGKVVR